MSRAPENTTNRNRWAVTLLVVAVLASLLPIAKFASPQAVAAGNAQVAGLPIRAAFYYPWYPEAEHWSTRYTPVLGKYRSSDPAVLATHVAEARYAGLDAFVSSYWGKDSKTAERLPLLLAAARDQGFHVAAYYEPESRATAPTPATLRADFDSLAALSSDPAWLRVGGKPVLFVYNTRGEASCAGIRRILTAAADRFYLNAKVFRGYRRCSSQPDSWHQYGPAAAYDQQHAFSATVSPGFDKFDESQPRLSRDLTRFQSDLARQVASGARWQL